MNRLPSLSSPAAPRDSQGRPLDVIELHQLAVHCIVGVYPAERGTPQPLELDAALYLDTRRAATEGSLRDTVDYARLSGELRFLLETADFRMLETAAEALCRYILAPPTGDSARARIQAVTLRLSKPEALDRAGLASLCIHRAANESPAVVEQTPFGHVDVLFRDAHVDISRLRIAPGRSLITSDYERQGEAELVLGHGLVLQGRPVPAGTGFRWPGRQAHRYDNPRDIEQTVLCVDRPASVSSREGDPMPVTGRAYYPIAASAPEAENEAW